MSQPVASLVITRGDPVAGAHPEVFEVPFVPGQSVLDGLIWLRRNRDAGLAFRHSCISANVCKECVMRIDGDAAYACVVRLEPRRMVLEPLPNKAWMRDLVCDTVPPKERL